MPVVQVSKIDQAKSGKTRVYFDGKNDWKDAFYLGNRCDVPTMGDTIEASTVSKTFPNSKYPTWFLESWKPAGGPKNGDVSGNGPANGAIPQNVTNGRQAPLTDAKGLPLDTKDCAIIYEVFVKACIDKELIHDRDSAFSWTEIAYRCIEQLRTGKVQAFNDKWPDGSVGNQLYPDKSTGLAGSIEDGEPPYKADF